MNAQPINDTLTSISSLGGTITYYYESDYYLILGSFETASAGDILGGFVDEDVAFARSFITFDLSDLPIIEDSLIVVSSASIHLYQNISRGNHESGVFPIWDTPGGDTMFCILDHIDIGNQFTLDDWTAGDYTDSQTLTSNIGIISSTAIVEFKVLDVTSYLQADIIAGNIRSQYRIRFPVDYDNDRLADIVYFKMGNASNLAKRPYVSLEYTIEPSNSIHQSIIPKRHIVIECYPNPFNSFTKITYQLDNPYQHVALQVFDILGEEVRLLVDALQAKGKFDIIWDAKENNGQDVPSGIYLYQLKLDNHIVKTNKLTVLR